MHNSFGKIFKVTTWGESHGPAIGCVIDGCPAGLPITADEINLSLQKRRPGYSSCTSARKEKDQVEILSGIIDGTTSGAPLSFLIRNIDVDSSPYEKTKDIFKPGHAHYSYLKKYGCFDHRGGGRSSGRETACRVAAGAVAAKYLSLQGVKICAYLSQVGPLKLSSASSFDKLLKERTALFCSSPSQESLLIELIEKLKKEGDSTGAKIHCIAQGLPSGWGDPVYDKLEARLAYAMMGIPASKAFSIGEGFDAVKQKGSEHNDAMCKGSIPFISNRAGGTLGGISTGMPLDFSVAFKPTSSIAKQQKSLNISGEEQDFAVPKGSRHDPCIGIRAVAVVEAMTALVLMDAALCHRHSQI